MTGKRDVARAFSSAHRRPLVASESPPGGLESVSKFRPASALPDLHPNLLVKCKFRMGNREVNHSDSPPSIAIRFRVALFWALFKGTAEHGRRFNLQAMQAAMSSFHRQEIPISSQS
jgi:hypothetical protein